MALCRDSLSFGDQFADIYDEMYAWYVPSPSQIATIAEFTPARTLLEIGAGTGRLAIPLAEAGLKVTALDSSERMLAILRGKAAGLDIKTITADASDFCLEDRYSTVLAAWNMVALVGDEAEQLSFLKSCAMALEPAGCVIIETMIPHPESLPGRDKLKVIAMSNAQVVLEVGKNVPAAQRCEFQYVVLRHGEPVRLIPHRMRYLWPNQLDALASAAGLVLHQRFADWRRGPFVLSAASHVSVFRLPGADRE